MGSPAKMTKFCPTVKIDDDYKRVYKLGATVRLQELQPTVRSKTSYFQSVFIFHDCFNLGYQ